MECMEALVTDKNTGVSSFLLKNKHNVGNALWFGRVRSTHTSTNGYTSNRVKIAGVGYGKDFADVEY